MPEGLVLLDEAPGADFTAEPGKRYFVVDPNDGLMAFWRQHAFDRGLSNDEFMAGVVAFADRQAERAPSDEEIQVANKSEWAKLGEHGEARASHTWRTLVGWIGEDRAKAIERAIGNAAAIEAVEALIDKAGGPRFSPGNATPSPDKASEASLRAMMREPDYWTNPEKQRRVAEGFKRLYPGTLELNTA